MVSDRKIEVFSFDLDGTLTQGSNGWKVVLDALDAYQPDVVEKWYSGGYECYEEWLQDTLRPLLGRPRKEFTAAVAHSASFLRPGMGRALLRIKQARPNAHIIIVSGGLGVFIGPIVRALEAEAAAAAGPEGVPGGQLFSDVLANDLVFDDKCACGDSCTEFCPDAPCSGYTYSFLEKNECIPNWVESRIGRPSTLAAVHAGDAFNDICAFHCTAGGVCMPKGHPTLARYAFASLEETLGETEVADALASAMLAAATAFEAGKCIKPDGCPAGAARDDRGTGE